MVENELPRVILAHLGWLKMYAEGATEGNYADMALRASRQVDELEEALVAAFARPSPPADAEIEALVERLTYLAEAVEVHAHLFPTPQHMKGHAAKAREAASALSASASRIRELEAERDTARRAHQICKAMLKGESELLKEMTQERAALTVEVERLRKAVSRALESLCGDYPSMAADLRAALNPPKEGEG